MRKRGVRDEPHSSLFNRRCPASAASPISCSRYERGQHHEEGDPGQRYENVSRRTQVTHRGPPGGVVWCNQLVRAAVLPCSSVMGVTQ
jgi:hypothetical protein